MSELRTYQPSFTAGELSPALAARIDLAKYGSGLKQAVNMFIHPHGGASNRAGLRFIREVKDSADIARMIPFQFNTEQSYILEFGDEYFRVFRDGGLVLDGGLPYEVVTPYSQADINHLVYIQEADVMYVVHENYPVHKISRFADNNWTIEEVDFQPAMTAPTGVVATALVGSGATLYSYKVAAVNALSGEESLPSLVATVTNNLSTAGNKNQITWSAVVGADQYIVYKNDNGVYGYIGGTAGLSFVDENIVADLADGPQSERNPFVGTGNYPRCCSFVEQRLVFASTKNDPQAIWMSQSANYENFGYSSPAKASDAVTFRIKARQVNEIRALIASKGMMVLTSAAEWIVSGGSQSDAITPGAIKIDNHGYRGASRVQPIVVGNTVLFAQDRGCVIRDFSYAFAEDSFVGRDLTILARHLFEDKAIKAWAYAQAPYSIVWAVLDDGSLTSLTHINEHEVWAWTHPETGAGGKFEDVAVIAEGNLDTPYFIVRREINGVERRYIEKMENREFVSLASSFFVDSGLSYFGSPITIVTGLDHLAGQEVVALSEGNVVRNLTVGPVTGGVGVVLPHPSQSFRIGLPITATLETMGLDLGQVQGLGTVQGRYKSISEVTLRVEKTRGIWIGPEDADRDSDKLVEYKQRSVEAWNEAIQVYTGDIAITPHWAWNTHGRMVVKQFDPLPMTITAIMPDPVIGK